MSKKLFPKILLGAFVFTAFFSYIWILSLERNSQDQNSSGYLKGEVGFVKEDLIIGVEPFSDQYLVNGETLKLNLSSNKEIELVNDADVNFDFLEKKAGGYSYDLKIVNIPYGDTSYSLFFTDDTSYSSDIEFKVKRSRVKVNDDGSKEWIDGDYLASVVNKEYSLPSSYNPPDLVYLSELDIPVTYGGMMIRRIAAREVQSLINDSRKVGVTIYVTSAYRSYSKQIDAYNFWLSVLGQKEADRASAHPGHSEHQLGTTIDFTSPEVNNGVSDKFINTKAGSWLNENAHKYGFVMSYPLGSEPLTGYKFEPWHYRYVGGQLASEIKESGLIPIEYLKIINGIGD